MTLSLRLALLACVLTAGCSKREDLDGERRAVAGATTGQSEPNQQELSVLSLDSGEAVAVNLYAARPLFLGYRRGALVIDAGSATFAKFVDGGVRKDWHRGLELADSKGKAKTASAVRGLAAEIYFPLDADPGGILKSEGKLQIRFTALPAVENQLVSVFLNEQKLRDLRMSKKEWQSYTLQAPAEALRVGENKLRFYFRSAGSLGGFKSAAAFSQFVLGDSISEESPFQTASFEAGRLPKQALVVPAASRMSTYLLVPPGASKLTFSFAGKGKATILIRGAKEEESSERWSQVATPANWEEVSVPLGAWRKSIVRIDFLSEGKMAWADMQVQSAERSEAQGELRAPSHIILWSVSSLRSDRLRRPVARAFRRFSESGFTIAQAQASVPAAGGSHASAMTGRMRVRGTIPDSYTTLAERLQEAGYATALISGNGFVNDQAGFAQGFDHYDNPMRRQHHFGARTLWRQASRFLQKHKQERSFVHIVTVEPHVPYRPSDESLAKEWVLPAPFAPAKTLSLGDQINKGHRKLNANEQAYIRALYDATVSDVDSAFAAMLEEVEELGLRGDIAIVLSGDHGEEIWDRNTFGHGASLFQESLLSPLTISSPGLADRKPPERSSSIDLMPTLLDLVGLVPGPEVQGRSLLRDPRSLDARPTMAAAADGSRALRWGRFKLVQLPAGHLRLYDLDADPSEQKDLAAAMPVATRALRNLLSAAVAHESQWPTARWGSLSSLKEAFARDQGL